MASQSDFRSRRSYPSLNRTSLAPLTPYYPIDDDNDLGHGSQDYFSPQSEALNTPTRTSYLSSYSVPGTPGVLSRTPSRSGSRVRHHSRSKSSTPIHLSDSNLQERNVHQSLHHQSGDSGSGTVSASASPTTSRRARRSAAHRHQPSEARDPEWILRAGVALASTAREEKGQSWLAKRESSTSLVSEAGNYEVDAISHALRTGISRRTKSDRSTPAAAHSRSRVASRRNSRPDLSMTGLEMSTASPISKGNSLHIASAPRTPSNRTSEDAGSSTSFLPHFIDERVRAEMRDTIQENLDDDYDSMISDYWDSEEDEEEIDERELQRLTRERGFGLGSWIDRLVEWTLFGVDDWPLSSSPDAVTNPPAAELHADLENDPPHDLSDRDDDETRSQMSDACSEINPMERAGDHGGWDDAGWFFRTIRQALIST
ncbi:DUF3984 domain-containing protein [Aspergillus mulundensis]|uniref:DUF3984 domain-containing protein n=1 Tax=Aspergillus mulundensis TaxID=1810919 RepID=A0A3D8Q5N8_9EURO|nr:Uncharacterized protein DSM5745_11534 [Aspergillus mulundensis]RDW57136.1 Uncharacterized protein DSM5745_11534 [Aspergillus mulundensis]